MAKPTETAKDWTGINRRKIPKAVYMLLRKYHSLFGLAVLPWSKTPGNHYFKFFSLAMVDPFTKQCGEVETPGFRSNIYQDSIGMPAWDQAGRQIEHPYWTKKEVRTDSLVAWYEEQLNLASYFREHETAIEQWRGGVFSG